MLRNLPIRVLLPGTILVFGVLATFFIGTFASDNTRKLAIDTRSKILEVKLVQFQMDLEDAEAQELRLIQRRVTGLSHDPNVLRASLIDPDGVVVTSTRLGDMGRPHVSSDVPEALRTERIRADITPYVVQSGDRLFGAIRICRVNLDQTADWPSGGCGVLRIQESLATRFALIQESERSQFIYGLITSLVLSLIAFIILYSTFLQRLELISRTITAFAQGDLTARVATSGRNELSRIGQGIDAMLDEVTDNQQRLRDREDRLQALFNENTEGLVVINANSIITEFNHRSEEIFGFQKDEVIGKPLAVLMPERHRAMHQTMMTRYMETGVGKVIGKQPLEIEGRHKDGHLFPVKIAVSEVSTAGETTFIGSITDLSVFRAMEQQAQRAQKMEAVGSLTGGIAHDFNNLLGIIIGNIEMAQRKVSDPEAVNRRLEKAAAAALRGSELTRRLLAFTRQKPERRSAVDVTEIFDGLQDLMASSLTSKIKLSVSHPGALPPLLVDAGALEDAVVNLLINARDAMPSGGEICLSAREVEVDAPLTGLLTEGEVRGPVLEIVVADGGTGIPPDVLNRIFEPFFSTKPKDQGTGLGLAMVYGFIKRSSGAISIDSAVGQGTTIKIFLPIAEEKTLGFAPESNSGENLPRARDSERILVVEDEPAMLELAVSYLNELGYEVVAVENGKAAQDVLASDSRFDMLFSDVVMPGGVDGLALAEHVDKHFPEMRILLASGFIGDSRQRQFDRWTDFVLDKPYSMVGVAHRVRSTLDMV